MYSSLSPEHQETGCFNTVLRRDHPVLQEQELLLCFVHEPANGQPMHFVPRFFSFTIYLTAKKTITTKIETDMIFAGFIRYHPL